MPIDPNPPADRFQSPAAAAAALLYDVLVQAMVGLIPQVEHVSTWKCWLARSLARPSATDEMMMRERMGGELGHEPEREWARLRER